MLLVALVAQHCVCHLFPSLHKVRPPGFVLCTFEWLDPLFPLASRSFSKVPQPLIITKSRQWMMSHLFYVAKFPKGPKLALLGLELWFSKHRLSYYRSSWDSSSCSHPSHCPQPSATCMSLPRRAQLAEGTLRTLYARSGFTRSCPTSAEQLHQRYGCPAGSPFPPEAADRPSANPRPAIPSKNREGSGKLVNSSI